MFEGDYVRIWLEHNILFLEYKDDLALTQEVAREVLSNRITFQQNREYAVFCNPSGILSADPKALDYLAKEGTILIRAIAFYAPTPIPHLLTEFFLEAHKKNVPAEMFKYKNQAIKYLTPYSQ